MNSKELLEQAKERAGNIKKASDELKAIEEALEASKSGIVTILYAGYHTYLGEVLNKDRSDGIRNIVESNISYQRDEKVSELEKLLGIARVGEIVVDTFNDDVLQIGEQVPEPDPIEEKLSEVLKEEAKRIEALEDNSLDKYPAKNKKYSGYPEGMTEELVREMYIDQNMKISDIADHFKVPYSKANNFISKHKLHRVSQAPKTEEPKTEPDDKESHSQS